MTTVTFDPDEFLVDIKGHAGAGEPGSDPVCAGISVLTFTLVNAAAEYYEAHIYINDIDAEVRVRCYPDPEQERLCMEMLRTIMRGFELIHEEHPENIKIIGGYIDG
jgi:uncharacterized protein YsxB (DUF464 family)